MASLYNGNVMKSIVTISSACALAFAGMASAQDAPAPAPAPAAETPAAPTAPAAEVSKEAKEAADQMLALMKEMSATLSTVKDKATADAAAEKMAKINEKGEALSKSAQKVQAEMDAAMQARQAELLPIFMGMMTDMQRLQQADFFGSQALKDAMKQTGASGPEEGVEVEEEVEVEAVPAPLPLRRKLRSRRQVTFFFRIDPPPASLGAGGFLWGGRPEKPPWRASGLCGS